MALDLAQLPQEAREQIEELTLSRQRLELENKLLREQIRLLHLEKFGPASEKLGDNQLTLLGGEPSVTAAEVQQEAQQPEVPATPATAPKRRNQEHPGRNPLPQHLERREEVIGCSAEKCRCGQCGQEKKVIGYELTEELDVVPATYFVRVIKREKRACSSCPEAGVSTAAAPEKIIPKSKLSDRLIIDTLIKKYDEHLPLYRQCAIIERDAEVELSRQTLVDSVMAVGRLLEPIRQVLRQDLLSQDYIQADETPLDCQSQRTPGKNHQAYMWEYSRPGGPVVFDFRMGRERAGPAEFLKGFKGVLQCDGYGAYDRLGEAITYAGCWAHARREFYEAHLLTKEDPVPLEILRRIGELYAIEKEAREKGLTPQKRYALRQERSRPILQALKPRITEIRANRLPKEALGKACGYAINQWERLTRYLGNGQIEIDNNWCENAIRPLALGRKNWLHIGSEEAGAKVAAIVSVMETCRRLNINIRQYLNDILPKLPEWPIQRVAELSPLTWSPPSNK